MEMRLLSRSHISMIFLRPSQSVEIGCCGYCRKGNERLIASAGGNRGLESVLTQPEISALIYC